MRHAMRSLSAGVFSLVLLAGIAPGTLLAHDGDDDRGRGLYPPQANPYGTSFGQWTAAWWRWAFSIPIANHPLFDNGPCDTNQGGPVFFLGGAFTGVSATRECTVPAGKSILLPVANGECSNQEPPPFFGGNEAEMRACAISFMDTYLDLGSLVATIDGRTVRNLTTYRVQSPLYSFSAPADGLFGPTPVSGQSVSDGYWLFLKPLSEGRHTIHFEANFPAFSFPIDVTYNLHVRGGRGGHGRIDGEPTVQEGTWGMVKDLYRR